MFAKFIVAQQTRASGHLLFFSVLFSSSFLATSSHHLLLGLSIGGSKCSLSEAKRVAKRWKTVLAPFAARFASAARRRTTKECFWLEVCQLLSVVLAANLPELV